MPPSSTPCSSGCHRRKSPLAATVIRVAREADRPVIVTRGHPDFGTLLAATDLEDRQVPLLRTAAQLGHELDATVVAVHGVLGPHAGRVSLQSPQRELKKVTGCFDAPVESVVVPLRGAGQLHTRASPGAQRRPHHRWACVPPRALAPEHCGKGVTARAGRYW